MPTMYQAVFYVLKLESVVGNAKSLILGGFLKREEANYRQKCMQNLSMSDVIKCQGEK